MSTWYPVPSHRGSIPSATTPSSSRTRGSSQLSVFLPVSHPAPACPPALQNWDQPRTGCANANFYTEKNNRNWLLQHAIISRLKICRDGNRTRDLRDGTRDHKVFVWAWIAFLGCLSVILSDATPYPSSTTWFSSGIMVNRAMVASYFWGLTLGTNPKKYGSQSNPPRQGSIFIRTHI